MIAWEGFLVQVIRFLEEKSNSSNGIEILAIVDDRVIGTAEIEAVGMLMQHFLDERFDTSYADMVATAE